MLERKEIIRIIQNELILIGGRVRVIRLDKNHPSYVNY